MSETTSGNQPVVTKTRIVILITGLLAAAVQFGLGIWGWGGWTARALEGATLFLAAAAYVAHVMAHHETTRELLTRSILVSAFALWGLVQIAPGLPGNAVLNDVVIVLFVVDLAILVSPWL